MLRQLFPSGVLPESRYLHMAALASSQLVVFGGEHINKPGSAKADDKVNDLWAYSARANAWHQLAKSACKMEHKGPALSNVGSSTLRLLLLAGILGPIALASAAVAWQRRRRVGNLASAPSLAGVEMPAGLAAGASGAATRKKDYQSINTESEFSGFRTL